MCVTANELLVAAVLRVGLEQLLLEIAPTQLITSCIWYFLYSVSTSDVLFSYGAGAGFQLHFHVQPKKKYFSSCEREL